MEEAIQQALADERASAAGQLEVLQTLHAQQMAEVASAIDQQVAEHKRMNGEQFEKERASERTRRIDELKKRAVRRLGNQMLATGFMSWVHSHEEVKQSKRLLKIAGARLRRPELAASIAHWKEDWTTAVRSRESERKSDEEMERRERENELMRVRYELEEVRSSMVKERDGLMARIKMLESAQEAGMASAKKINETDRERYVQSIARTSCKRFLFMEKAKGFTTWQHACAKQKQQMTKLRQAGMRMARPRLAACVHLWRAEWESEVRRKQAATSVDDMSKKLMSMTSEVTRLKHELTKAQALASHGRLSEQKCKLLEKKVEQDRRQGSRIKDKCKAYAERGPRVRLHQVAGQLQGAKPLAQAASEDDDAINAAAVGRVPRLLESRVEGGGDGTGSDRG